MNKIIKWLVLVFIGFNLVLCAWSVLHHDIYYYTDIGRDFLIFAEIAAKKIVLIGPRADAQGLFHGIAWHYLNMPAYFLGKGNPVVVGWFWILLAAGLIAEAYFIVKKLFDNKSGLIAAILISTYIVPDMQGLFHGKGAWFVILPLFYFFVRYAQTKKSRYLIAHLIALGFLVQFEIGVGIPFVVVSILGITFLIFKNKKFYHFLSFGVLFLFALTFLLFDLRHNFLQIRSFIAYAHGARNGLPIPFLNSLSDRISHITYLGINLFKFPEENWNYLVFGIFLYSFYRLVKKPDKYKSVYLTFLYFYLGFYLFSLYHGGLLIEFWWMPVSLLPIIMFSTLHRYFPKILYFVVVAAIVGVGTAQNISYIKKITNNFGKVTTSWLFQLNVAKTVFNDAPPEFGFFIYAPDVYGYQEKYAMFYAQRLYPKKADIFVKKKTTYVIVEPPPAQIQGLSPDWWIQSRLNLTKQPDKVIKLGQGFKIEKFTLTDNEIKIPSEVTPADWLFYR